MPAKRYKVMLSEAERDELKELVSKGKAAARKLTHARILLLADEGEGGPAWKDRQIVEGLSSSQATVERVRQACVEEGLERALNPSPRSWKSTTPPSTAAGLIWRRLN